MVTTVATTVTAKELRRDVNLEFSLSCLYRRWWNMKSGGPGSKLTQS